MAEVHGIEVGTSSSMAEVKLREQSGMWMGMSISKCFIWLAFERHVIEARRMKRELYITRGIGKFDA